ncbi:MAG: hypothetical protein AB7P22_14915 [Vicinamibacterales bacterium]
MDEQLNLRVSDGKEFVELHLDAAMAYGLAGALLANISDIAPWQGHPDAQLVERLHDLAFMAARNAAQAQRVAVPMNRDLARGVFQTIDSAACALTLLSDIHGEKANAELATPAVG